MMQDKIELEVVLVGIEAIEQLGKKIEEMTSIFNRLDEVVGKIFIECDYCGQAMIRGLACPGCGRHNLEALDDTGR